MRNEQGAYDVISGPHYRKHIVELPAVQVPWGGSTLITSKPLKVDFIARELVVPSWLMGHQLIVGSFLIGKTEIIEGDHGIILEAFKDYKFEPTRGPVGATIKIVIMNERGDVQWVRLSVKGKVIA